MTVQSKLAERTQLLSQLEQAKMQEQVSASLQSMSALAAPGNTPSLAEVRDKIESRYAKALGSAELASNSVEGRMLEVQKSTLDMAGASRLDQIRQSMAGTSSPPARRRGPSCTKPARRRRRPEPARPPLRPAQHLGHDREVRAPRVLDHGEPAELHRGRGGAHLAAEPLDGRDRVVRRGHREAGGPARWSRPARRRRGRRAAGRRCAKVV